jgi:hypothetical protein
MAEVVHKYLCAYCKLYVFGETTANLASTVNSHNTRMHPTDFANWTPEGITHSKQYSGLNGPLPQYLKPYAQSKEWGDAKPPDISERDKIFLSTNGIKW